MELSFDNIINKKTCDGRSSPKESCLRTQTQHTYTNKSEGRKRPSCLAYLALDLVKSFYPKLFLSFVRRFLYFCSLNTDNLDLLKRNDTNVLFREYTRRFSENMELKMAYKGTFYQEKKKRLF